MPLNILKIKNENRIFYMWRSHISKPSAIKGCMSVWAALPWTVNVCKINRSLERCLQFYKFWRFRAVVKNSSFWMDSFFIKCFFYSIMNFLRWNFINNFAIREWLFLSEKVTMQHFPGVVPAWIRFLLTLFFLFLQIFFYKNLLD